MIAVEELSRDDLASFDSEVRPRYRPVVIRGFAKHWPLIEAGQASVTEALGYLTRFDSGQPTDIMVAPASEKGRFFYTPDVRGFNFQRQQATISQLARALHDLSDKPDAIGIYAGATPVATHLPGFEGANPFPLASQLPQAIARIWLGSATQVATHFDLSDNFAVVALGNRRFTLFPPEATGDLYIGPFDLTPAGQPTSMVDPLVPDHDRYPRYARALEQAQFAELNPGDAIYIPTLWWHHVAATAPVNILVNYWHNDSVRGGGFLALIHAIMAIRDQPPAQKDAWRAWFDHFVFGDDAASAADHLPPNARMVTGPPSPQRDEMIRRFLAQVLGTN